MYLKVDSMLRRFGQHFTKELLGFKGAEPANSRKTSLIPGKSGVVRLIRFH